MWSQADVNRLERAHAVEIARLRQLNHDLMARIAELAGPGIRRAPIPLVTAEAMRERRAALPRVDSGRGMDAYELRRGGTPWLEVADRLGYSKGAAKNVRACAAVNAARRYARHVGAPWPIRV